MGQSQLILKKNDPAPYLGVLIPEATYRSMHVDIFAKDRLMEEMAKCSMERSILETQPKPDTTLWFASGLSLGLLASFLIVTRAK